MTGDSPTWERPAGLARLGSRSVLATPYVIRSPHRIHIGDDVRIDHDSVLSVVEEFGGKRFEPTLLIGDRVTVGAHLLLHCTGRIDIGDGAAISNRVYIGDSFRTYDDPALTPDEMPMAEPEPVRVRANAFVGTGSILLPGVTIGERAIVAAGSVVSRDVPPRTVVLGNPARVVRSWDESSGRWVTGPLTRESAE